MVISAKGGGALPQVCETNLDNQNLVLKIVIEPYFLERDAPYNPLCTHYNSNNSNSNNSNSNNVVSRSTNYTSYRVTYKI